MSSVVTATSSNILFSKNASSSKRAPTSPQDSSPDSQKIIEDRFFWTYTEEPHKSRRHAIIKAHPEILKLCGPEPLTKYLVLSVVSLQITASYLLCNYHLLTPTFLATSYIIGATANQNLFLAIHEISHNLAFRTPLYNRLFAILANLPIGLPYSAAFRPYHLTHHKSLGVAGLDTDLPTAMEAVLLDSVLGKAFFCTFQILFYAIRPMLVYRLPFTSIHFLNVLAQFGFNYFVFCLWGWKPLLYFLLSSFLAGSLHPCAAHFIAEHYILSALKNIKPQTDTLGPAATPTETYSYYGPLNVLCYNVGLHNEHHDFPAIPWTRLPAVRTIAAEFYDELPCHDSWVGVMFTFITDSQTGMWARVKRKEGGRLVGGVGKGGKGEKGEKDEWREEEYRPK
jgi:sphingolipid 4-desaturase/C4-monooxygenase